MSERRIHLYVLILILVCVLAIIIFYAVRYIPLFNVSGISIQGMENVPSSTLQALAEYNGINRFSIDEKALEEHIEENPLIESCVITYSFPSQMNVTLVPSEEECILYDGNGYWLIAHGYPQKFDIEDAGIYAEQMCTIEVSPDYISYMERYGVPDSFRQVLELISRVNEENSWLITHIKYDNNTTDGFGQIVLSLESLNSLLYVRQRVSQQRISDSIRVIQTAMGDDPAGRIDFGTVRWDLYSTALVRRTVE